MSRLFADIFKFFIPHTKRDFTAEVPLVILIICSKKQVLSLDYFLLETTIAAPARAIPARAIPAVAPVAAVLSDAAVEDAGLLVLLVLFVFVVPAAVEDVAAVDDVVPAVEDVVPAVDDVVPAVELVSPP